MSKRLKILVSAYACEPQKGSEPGVGWNWVKQIARFHDVWVITRSNNKTPIEKALDNEPMKNVHWIYYDLPKWIRFWKKGERGVHIYYYLWQVAIYFIARRYNKEIRFNILHHVTFVKYWAPSFLSFLKVPLVWGPVGGGESTPKQFYKEFSLRGRLYEYVRNLARLIGEIDPFVRVTAKYSIVTISTTRETESRLKRIKSKNILILSQVAVSNNELKKLIRNTGNNSNNTRFVSVGTLIHWKGFHKGLESFVSIANNYHPMDYWIIGYGPEKKKLNKYIIDSGMNSYIKLLGSKSREEVLDILNECDVLVHPSFHDSGGMVCVEAMAAGKPVICLDLGGPALLVTDDTGFKIPTQSPDQVTKDMAKAMLTLANNPELRKRMGEAGRRRVKKHFLWEKKGDFINNIYQDIVSGQ
jgi:glycosyltransferase involved in cell wall biosynthesis